MYTHASLSNVLHFQALIIKISTWTPKTSFLPNTPPHPSLALTSMYLAFQVFSVLILLLLVLQLQLVGQTPGLGGIVGQVVAAPVQLQLQ